MRILIVPMPAMAPTAGPFSRARLLAEAFSAKGFSVALCAAEDVNYRPIPGVPNYFLSVPVPFGLPEGIGLRAFSFAEKLGLPGKKPVRSFEEVLHFTGATAYPYFKKSVSEIHSAIASFQPDLIYSEFNLSAIAAAKAEQKPVFASYSYPAQPSYAASPQFARGVRRALAELHQAPVRSALELFLRADLRIVPSIRELEPIEGKDTVFAGTLKKAPELRDTGEKDLILAYLGTGTISKEQTLNEISDAFADSEFEVFLAGMDSDCSRCRNIHTNRTFDFSALLPRAAVFLNHGGQNSIADGLLYGVPQLIYPGKVFERQYNADSIVKNKAGIRLAEGEFTAEKLRESVRALTSDRNYRENSTRLGALLTAPGGADAVIRSILERIPG
jgi:hypothetical protein